MDKSRILVASAPIEREVTFSDGTVEKCYFKQASGAVWRRWNESERSEDQDVRIHAMQRLIAACLCEKDGTPVLTDEEAVGITVEGVNALFPHVVDIAKGSEEAKKGSPSGANSGSATRSRSSSASSSGKSTKSRKVN